MTTRGKKRWEVLRDRTDVIGKRIDEIEKVFDREDVSMLCSDDISEHIKQLDNLLKETVVINKEIQSILDDIE